MDFEIQKTINYYKSLKDAGFCPFCSKDMKLESNRIFNDNLSIDEFKISGLCQKCQDKTFGE